MRAVMGACFGCARAETLLFQSIAWRLGAVFRSISRVLRFVFAPWRAAIIAQREAAQAKRLLRRALDQLSPAAAEVEKIARKDR